MEGERERERENDGWINREKEEVEDLYLSFSKVSSLFTKGKVHKTEKN